jgi:hypothetical protein
MSDLQSGLDGFGGVYVPQTTICRPPIALLSVVAVVFAAAIVMFAIDSRVGYGLCVVATILGSYVSYKDQQARSDANYLTLGWFRPLRMLLGYATTLVACAHIAILAIESAR